MCARLQHLRIRFTGSSGDVGSRIQSSIYLHCSSDTTQHAAAVHAQLAVLRAMQLPDTDPNPTICIDLCSTALAADTLAALQGLPDWPQAQLQLSVSSCTWPMEAAQYTQLAQVVPVSYREWFLMGVSDEVVQSVCAGVNQRRQGLGLGPVTVWRSGPCTQVTRVGEHVILI